MPIRSLVTGAAGFLGSHVAEACVGLGQEVVGLDDLSGGFVANIPAGVEFVQGSVTDAGLLDRLCAERRFDVIYHLAAYAAEGLSHFIRLYNYRTNLLGSVALINAAVNHGVRRFVFTSSIATYGTGRPPYTEDQTPAPEDPYGISKYAVEMDLRAAHDLFGLEYTIFRPHNVYGERQNIADAYRNVVCIFMNQALRGEELTIFGDGSQTRAFSYVGDVAPLMARAGLMPEARNEVFNIGAATPYSVRELAEGVAEALGVEPRVRFLPARVEVMHAHSSVEKAARVLGLRPGDFVPLAEGLGRVAEDVRRRGATPPVGYKVVEIERNLPAAWAAHGLKREPGQA